MTPQLTPDERAARDAWICELREQGLSYRAIAEEVGCSPMTAWLHADPQRMATHCNYQRKYRERPGVRERERERIRAYRQRRKATIESNRQGD